MDWPHAPIHRFADAGVYFITAGTHLKRHYFRTRDALEALQESLFANAQKHDCLLQAWSLFSNHYHLVVSCDAGGNVREMLNRFHVDSAIERNKEDGVPGRQVWFQFRDTRLTHEGSWLARLKYTNENAVHHGLVQEAEGYRWCSAAWFENHARPSFVATVRNIKIDRVNVYDEYAPRQ